MKTAIRNVLEREGMIAKDNGKWIRDEEPTETINGIQDGEEEEEQDEMDEERAERIRKKRIRILLDILNSLRSVVKEQARKRPEAVVNRFQAKRINSILEEIRKMVQGRGLEDLMEEIEMPREECRDGEAVTVGMSYSDAEILLECYSSIIWFTQSEIKG